MRDGVGVGLSALGKNSQQVSISIHTTCGLVPEALVSLQFLMVTIPLLYGYVSQLSLNDVPRPPHSVKPNAAALFVSFPTLLAIPIQNPLPPCSEDQWKRFRHLDGPTLTQRFAMNSKVTRPRPGKVPRIEAEGGASGRAAASSVGDVRQALAGEP